MRTIITTTAALLALLALIATTSAQTQPNSPSLSNSASADLGSISQKLGEETLSLKAQTAEALKKLDGLEDSLTEKQKNTEQAMTTVNELLALLNDAASRLSKDGNYVRTLSAEEDTVTKIADRARAHPDPEVRKLASWYQGKADEIAALLRDAEQLRTQLLTQIDRLDQEKERLSFAVAATNIEAFIKDARSYLDILSNIATGAKGLADNIGNTFGSAGATQ